MESTEKIHNLQSLNRAIRDLKSTLANQEQQLEDGTRWAQQHFFSWAFRKLFSSRGEGSGQGWRKWADLAAGGLTGVAAELLETWWRKKRKKNRKD